VRKIPENVLKKIDSLSIKIIQRNHSHKIGVTGSRYSIADSRFNSANIAYAHELCVGTNPKGRIFDS